MKQFNHIMVIGGTGMLAEATRYLCKRSEVLTLFSRLGRSVEGVLANVVPIQADYHDGAYFAEAVSNSIVQYGPPSLVLAWFHEDKPAYQLAEQLAAVGSLFSFFHVLGSASANPVSSLVKLRQPYEALSNIDYHQVVLGFKHESSRSRWLTNWEISQGMIQALNANKAVHIVGCIEPWDARPS
ncbi:hypothetical protein [Chitinivorax sp. B]|uniref:hypothetical protein n=1 Tax=Chitinivorax sp. B TaxID=2502235 RepID=UPI0010F73B64|nr:hypothetical protein [Chitinivorax sp. B]